MRQLRVGMLQAVWRKQCSTGVLPIAAAVLEPWMLFVCGPNMLMSVTLYKTLCAAASSCVWAAPSRCSDSWFQGLDCSCNATSADSAQPACQHAALCPLPCPRPW
jgi:hypothetical protein